MLCVISRGGIFDSALVSKQQRFLFGKSLCVSQPVPGGRLPRARCLMSSGACVQTPQLD